MYRSLQVGFVKQFLDGKRLCKSYMDEACINATQVIL